MVLYPAIDLLDGRCVRLKQGRFEDSTVYSEDPRAVAVDFARLGAEWLHLVDLSAAKDPQRGQARLLGEICASLDVPVQVGGGIRTLDAARNLLRSGARRVVVGSLALSDPALVLRLLDEFGGEAVTVALDVRIDGEGEPRVALQGWQEQSKLGIKAALAPYARSALKRILCTDIAKDGMMSGPNVGLYSMLRASFPDLEFQASGGIAGIGDLLALKEAGLESAIVGKAIYEGALDLRDAIGRCRAC